MVKVTVELVRKKAEHHDKQLAPLQEISLHQESIEKIEHIQNWCPKLKILLLQSNLISKIENLNKLKELEYLNLAINNIEIVENLDRCESLQKLDLTLNFIGELTSLQSLKNNTNLRMLYLSGNPCTDYKGYREYVITILPQLDVLDSIEIKRSDRILALQKFSNIIEIIVVEQELYKKKRLAQKLRLEKKIVEDQNSEDANVDDEEKTRRFWTEKSEHSPEVRIEMERQNQIKRDAKNPKEEKIIKKPRSLFGPDGRPYNINELKLYFLFKDENPDEYELEIFLYKYLDTSLIDIDLQPTYVRVVIKSKIFQIHLPEEISINNSNARRSQTTGHLLITMKKHNFNTATIENKSIDKIINSEWKKTNKEIETLNNVKRELLEIGPSVNALDLRIVKNRNEYNKNKCGAADDWGKDFEDNPDVPPLI